mgnify:CR=1 FL=1
MSIRSSLLKCLGGVPQEVYHVDVANLQDKIASLFSDLDDLKGTVKNVERDLQEFPDPSDLPERGLGDDVSELKDEVDQMKSDLEDIKSEHADLVNTVESLSDELENVSENAQALATDMQTVQTRLNVLAPNVPVSA